MNIITVANFKPQKNMIDVAKVGQLLIPNLPHTHLTLIGDGEQRKDVEDYVEKAGIKDHFEFLGWVKEETVYKMLDTLDYDVFLLTSLWEGLPRSMLQAGAAEIPCVCYAVDGVNDVLKTGKTGWPIPVGDYRRAAAAIHWIYLNPLAAILIAKRFAKKITKEFDIDLMVRKQERLYKKLAREKGLIGRSGKP